MTEYAVIYEQANDGGWNARAADLPVYAVGDTREEAEQAVREAILVHLEVLRDRGEVAPPGSGLVGTVSV